MARKNIFAPNPTSDVPTATDSEPIVADRPLANFERPQKRNSPVGALSQSLGGINEKARRAEELERQLSEGQAVVELDPALIDSSFVPDRLSIDEAGLETLAERIHEHGQQVPILVRPSTTDEGRFQVAYGHRRLAAIRRLGIKVKAVVRELTDDQLVVSQGQENNDRTDLSFIERSYFAYRLEQRGFGRETILSALGVDKSALSRMIALIAKLPSEIIEAIGPAPSFGRTKWADIADLLEDASKRSRSLKLINDEKFLGKQSDQRFELLYQQLKKQKPRAKTHTWSDGDGRKLVRISENSERLSLVFDKAIEPSFGAYVERELGALHHRFLEEIKKGD